MTKPNFSDNEGCTFRLKRLKRTWKRLLKFQRPVIKWMHDHKGNLTVGLDDYIYSPKFVERVKEDIERAWMIEGEVEPDFSTHPSYEYHQKFG